MKIKLTLALLVSIMPAGLLAQPHTTTVHMRSQSYHDRAPKIHDRAPKAHLNA